MLKPYLDRATYRELITSGAISEIALSRVAGSQIVHPVPDQTFPKMVANYLA